MKNILYVWKGIYPWDIRVEKFCKSLNFSGFNVFLLCRWNAGQPREEDFGYFKVRRAGFDKPRFHTTPVSINPFWREEIDLAVKDFKPDLIIVREILIAEAAADISHKYNLPVLMDMAEHYPAAMKGWNKYKKNFLRKLSVHYLDLPELTEKRSVRKMDGIITVCEEQVQRLEREYNFPGNKTGIVHNTPDINFLVNIKKPENPPVVFGHHGYMSAEKGLSKFLYGFIQASQQNSKIKLFLAGDGESYHELRTIANENNLNDRIIFSGKYQHVQLPAILETIDIGVLPYQVSLFNHYTIHNKLFDFFAAGRPVLVSQVKPLMRVVKETGTGFITDCENINSISDVILKIAETDISEYQQNCIKASEKYNWSVDSDNLITFINKFL